MEVSDTTSNVDLLLIVSDTSKRGLQSAVRIHKLAKDLNIGVGKSYLIINRVKDGISDLALNTEGTDGLDLAGTIPEDPSIFEFDLNGRATFEMPEGNPAVKAAFEIFSRIIP